MSIAVITLTRDRIGYTRHCFATLRDHAGCDYDHFVLDQGSTDGTAEWLLSDESIDVTTLSENIGISRGLNLLLDEAVNAADFDCVIKFDNDCELLTANTVRDVAEAAVELDAVLSPRILGLNNPPPTLERVKAVDRTAVIGGIFMAVPAHIYSDGYRYAEHNPVWGVDDSSLCSWWSQQGGLVGYLEGYIANHYETTRGQWDRYPDYFARTLAEGKPAL